jgi:hypothetical protein
LEPAWRAAEVFVDGPGRHPKDLAIKVIGWAICARVAGAWHSATGWLKPGESVTAGEGTATARAINLCELGGTVITDCMAVFKKWYSIRSRRRAAGGGEGPASRCWRLLAEALQRRPDVRCRWMPSHHSEAEAVKLGIPAAWHAGNAEADERAKEVSMQRDLPPNLLRRYNEHVSTAERVAATVAAIQLKRLKARTRTAEGAAIKERFRRQPGLPRRLRVRGTKRRLQPAEGADAAAQGACRAEDLLQVKPKDQPPAEAARLAVLTDAGTVAGVHDLRPVGPWPAEGSVQVLNGRVPGVWVCSCCGKKASDTSRAGELAKKPCGEAQWQSSAVAHELLAGAGGLSCRRCLLAFQPQHAGQAGGAQCPVPQLTCEGLHWPEGEASVRAVLGRLRGYRMWCRAPTAAAAAVEAAAEGGAAEQAEPSSKRQRVVHEVETGPPPLCWQPYVGHMAVKVGRGLWCLRCFGRPAGDYRAWKRGRCSELQPPQAMPGILHGELLRSKPLDANASDAVRARHAHLASWVRNLPGPRAVLGV